MDDEKESKYAAKYAAERAVSEIRTAIKEASEAGCDHGILVALISAMGQCEYVKQSLEGKN